MYVSGKVQLLQGALMHRMKEYYGQKNRNTDGMQQYVFNQLGYTDLAKTLNIPLINLHSGEMADVPVTDGYLFNNITLHKSVAETDLICSVPMMKTHVLATVTLSMKNLIGVYPGTVYYSARSWLHDLQRQKDPMVLLMR
jgi:uncharacterized protein (DUF362 family)